MYITYIVYREDHSLIGHHGKSTTKTYNLCFSCAVNAVIHNQETVESKIVEEEIYCKDCEL